VSSPQRFFVAPEAIESGHVRFNREQARQMMAVLRMSPGQTVTVLDNSGWQYLVALERLSPADAVGAVRTRTLVSSEPRTKITLYVGMIRAPKLEIVLQKCTELGVAAFVPVLCQRSLIGQADELNPAKLERWERIIVEAAEQSGRGKLPSLMPASPFEQSCEQARGLSLILWEGERETRLRDALQAVGADDGGRRRGPAARPFSVNLFIGPEGGFAEAEVERARSFGIQPVTFGPRILRAETASVAAVSAILYAQGDLG
jgi:16S rRNA (uracil1498-N3)-methyltransferase